MKANENKKRTGFILKLFLWINILNSVALLFAYLGTHISPNTFIYFSFFGLTYPVWLTIAVCFIPFWFIFKRKWIFISIVTIAIGFNHLRHFYALGLGSGSPEQVVKVLSYNVKIFNLYDLENREQSRNEIFSFLKQEDAGIYCFQEFFHQKGSTNFVTKDSLVKLLETPYYHERYTHELTHKRYFGVATFSKFPIINEGEIPFDNDPNNFCIYSDIVVPFDTIRVFNAHIGSIRFQDDDYRFFDESAPDDYYHSNEAGQRILKRLKIGFEKRALQAEKVAEEVSKSPYPVVLCGDLNDTPVSYCYRQFNQLLQDAFVASGSGVGTTYIGAIPSNRIDYIFYSNSFESQNFQTHDIHHSDHKPISCEIGKE